MTRKKLNTFNVGFFHELISVAFVADFFIHVNSTWIFISCVCLAGWLARCPPFHLAWTLHANFSTKALHTCHTYSHLWLLPFCATFSHTELGWELQGLNVAKPVHFTFSHTFKLIRMQYNIALKQFKLNILILILSETEHNRENSCCFFWLHQDAFNVDIHSDIHEPI